MNPWLDRGGEPFANPGEVAEWLRERYGGNMRNRVEELRHQQAGIDEADRQIAEGEE